MSLEELAYHRHRRGADTRISSPEGLLTVSTSECGVRGGFPTYNSKVTENQI